MSDPEEALAKLGELRSELSAHERSRVTDALRSGSSFGDVAKALGISRQAAHRRYRDIAHAPPEPLPLSNHARHAIRLAGEEAAAVGASALASEHLLLGVLLSGCGAAHALEAEGITVEATRECLRSGDGGAEPPRADLGTGRAILLEAMQIARARDSSSVAADHLALAAVNGKDGGALRAITALGVTVAAVRDRLGC